MRQHILQILHAIRGAHHLQHHGNGPHMLRLGAGLLLALALLCPAAGSGIAAAQPQKKVDPGFLALFNDIWPQAQRMGVSPQTHLKVLHALGQPDWSLGDVRKPRAKRPPAPAKDKRPRTKKARKPGPYTLPGKCYKRAQREFLRPADYFPEQGPNGLAAVVRRGQEKLKEHREALERTYRKYGIRPSVLLAIWGRETSFGRHTGHKNVLRTLATRAAYATQKWRRTFNRNHLLAALKIVDDGHVSIRDFKGSWLGATGHTQFMPMEFYRYAVNGDDDPSRIDIWSSPADAFASTANFLLTKGSHYKHGKVWEPGVTWGYEVKLPKRFDCTLESRAIKKPISTWIRDFGIRRAGLAPGQGHGFAQNRLNKTAYVMLPAGTKGPAFLALNNFEVFRHYNKSDLYALYLGYVADRINCDRPGQPCLFKGQWPARSQDFRFSVKKMCGLQILLRAHGLYDKKIDGLFGAGTRTAIGRFQKKAGLPLTCYPARSLFRALCRGKEAACAALKRQGAL